jgi:hypothetical protein
MRVFVGGFALLISLAGSALSQPRSLPPAGDCAAFAAQSSGGYWIGNFSGSYEDFNDVKWPLGGQGCFRSEQECRRWLNEAQSAAPNSAAMSCRPAQG